MKKLITFGGIVLLMIIAYNLFTFTVDETRKAAVLRFGEIIRVVEEPGLHFKVPFVNNVIYLDDRILNYDIQPRDILTSDQKRLTIDNYAIWRVGKSQTFIEANAGSIASAQARIDDIVYSDLRDILAKHTVKYVSVNVSHLHKLRHNSQQVTTSHRRDNATSHIINAARNCPTCADDADFG